MARMYDPAVVRWHTVDPNRQYWSSYLGMGNNPVCRVDPDGRDDWLVVKGKLEFMGPTSDKFHRIHKLDKNGKPYSWYKTNNSLDLAEGEKRNGWNGVKREFRRISFTSTFNSSENALARELMIDRAKSLYFKGDLDLLIQTTNDHVTNAFSNGGDGYSLMGEALVDLYKLVFNGPRVEIGEIQSFVESDNGKLLPAVEQNK